MPNPFGRDVRAEPEPEVEEQALVVTEEHPLAAPAENELVAEMQLHRDLTPQQIAKLTVWTAKQDLGMSVAQGPLVCREGCGFKEVCPLYEDNIHPIGKRCPVEGSLMLRWKRKWSVSLGMNLDKPDENDAFDLKLLDDLAAISMLKHRALGEMATEAPEIAEKIIAGYVDDQPMEKVILNPRVQLIERLGKLELKMYNELLSTRKAKFQVAGRIDDLSKRQAEMARKMREVRERELKKAEDQGEVLDADYEVK
jgi:hypothetical protein